MDPNPFAYGVLASEILTRHFLIDHRNRGRVAAVMVVESPSSKQRNSQRLEVALADFEQGRLRQLGCIHRRMSVQFDIPMPVHIERPGDRNSCRTNSRDLAQLGQKLLTESLLVRQLGICSVRNGHLAYECAARLKAQRLRLDLHER